MTDLRYATVFTNDACTDGTRKSEMTDIEDLRGIRYLSKRASNDYYEEAEEALEGIICSSDAECPKNQPKCRENHCQPECISNAVSQRF